MVTDVQNAPETQRAALAYRAIRTGGLVGRRGLPREVVELMYADYLRLKSISKTAKLWGRSRQGLWEVLSTAGFRLNSVRKHEAIQHGGLTYRRSGKGGFYRCTTAHRRMLHHVVWEEAHGPRPVGTEIIFKDGDRDNFALHNLRCQARTVASRCRGARNQFTKERVTARLVQYEGLVRSVAFKRFGWLPADGVADMINVGRAAIAEALASAGECGEGEMAKKAYWIARNAMNKASENARQNIRVPAWANGSGPSEVSISAPLGNDELTLEDVLAGEPAEPDERIEALRRALARLPGKSRELLQRRIIDGAGIRELSVECGLTQGKLRRRLASASAKLRSMVNQEVSNG
jgi:RNA polymerase sigma factor (sigma-70 family)